jgi:hypothetical protein
MAERRAVRSVARPPERRIRTAQGMSAKTLRKKTMSPTG